MEVGGLIDARRRVICKTLALLPQRVGNGLCVQYGVSRDRFDLTSLYTVHVKLWLWAACRNVLCHSLGVA